MQKKQDSNNEIKKEIRLLMLILIVSILALKILFFREELLVITRLILAFFWVFIIPGYIIMLYWKEKLRFYERLIIGVGLSGAIIGISSYYLGLLGVNIKYHTIILPLLYILVGFIFVFKNKFFQKKIREDKNNES